MSRTTRVLIGAAFLVVTAAIALRPARDTWVSMGPRGAAFLTITGAIWLQALPFLALGVAVSAAIAAFVPPRIVAKLMPRRAIAAVPAAGAAGILLPGCECASVPTARQLMRSGVHPAAALTFLLAAPAVNPVVLVSTAVAYAGRPGMVLARFSAGLLAAITVGGSWLLLDRGSALPGTDTPAEVPVHKWAIFRDEFVTEFAKAASWLVVGAVVAGLVKVFLPTQWLTVLSENWWLEALTLAVLAVAVALCSEADAFMAVSLTAFSPTAQLVFMTVGPMVDFKLMAMQYGAFGRRFVLKFAPLTFVICVLSGIVVGTLLFS